MSFKVIADTFSVARDSEHFIQLKTISKPSFGETAWLAIEIEGETKYARATVQTIIEAVEDVFFEKSELTPYERFENTLKEINVVIQSLKEKKGPKATGEISAILAIFSGNELHLTQSKNAEAYLIRKGKLSMISEGLSAKSSDLFVNIASGELQPDDKLVFATSRLLRLVTQSQLSQILNDGVTEATDALREMVMAESELSLGVTCLHVKVPQRASATMAYAKGNMVWGKIQGWIGQLGRLIGEKVPAAKGLQNKMQKLDLNMNRKGILVAVLAIVLVLILSVSVLMDSRRSEALREEYRQRIEAMNQDLLAANTKGYSNDKATANAILDKVEREARDILGENYFRDEVMILLEKAQEARDSINNTTRLKEAKPYVDLSQKSPTVKALGLVNLDDNFFAYEYNKLYEIILDQVLDPKPLDETEVVTAATPMEDQGVVVFMTQSGRILEYENGTVSFANTDDTTWKNGVALAAYGRNIYLLSPDNNQIYKYSRLRSNYSTASEYNLNADLAGGISMAIDGNVYILKKGGDIVKLFKSNAEPFTIEDLATDLSSATKIFTTPEIDNIYLLDTVNKQVIVIEKDRNGVARYVGQIVFENLEGVNDFYVDKNEDKLYLLTDQAIYQVDI